MSRCSNSSSDEDSTIKFVRKLAKGTIKLAESQINSKAYEIEQLVKHQTHEEIKIENDDVLSLCISTFITSLQVGVDSVPKPKCLHEAKSFQLSRHFDHTSLILCYTCTKCKDEITKNIYKESYLAEKKPFKSIIKCFFEDNSDDDDPNYTYQKCTKCSKHFAIFSLEKRNFIRREQEYCRSCQQKEESKSPEPSMIKKKITLSKYTLVACNKCACKFETTIENKSKIPTECLKCYLNRINMCDPPIINKKKSSAKKGEPIKGGKEIKVGKEPIKVAIEPIKGGKEIKTKEVNMDSDITKSPKKHCPKKNVYSDLADPQSTVQCGRDTEGDSEACE